MTAPGFAVGDWICWHSRGWHLGVILAAVPPGVAPDLALLPASYRPRFRVDSVRAQVSYLLAVEADRPGRVTYVYRPHPSALRSARNYGPTRPPGGARAPAPVPSPRWWSAPLTGPHAAFLLVAGIAAGALLGALYRGLVLLLG